MKNFFYTMSIVMSLLVFTACSDDSVNDFSPVPYPDEMEQEEPTPDETPQAEDVAIRHLLLMRIRCGK